MSTDLESLYQQVILDHARKRSGFGLSDDAVARHHELNPTCGDEITVGIAVDADGAISTLGWEGQGCSISQSSASMMSQAIKGKPVTEVRALVRRFKGLMSIPDEDGNPIEPDPSVKLGDLEALQGVVKFPVRIKCATLSWNTLLDALAQA